MRFKFGARSIKNISTTNTILQELAARIISRSEFDFGVLNNGGRRTAKEQNIIYKKGHSKCDGYKVKSYHQSGMAIDFVPYIDGKFTWESKKAFLQIAKLAYEEVAGMYTGDYFLHWGGFWSALDLNGNGLLEPKDKIGWDAAHFELRKYKQVRGVYPIKWA
jgi:peptidoglycan L-alanyl-D-glutamate endopeptidase CwlK